MASGLLSSSTPIEPTQVWTIAEWRDQRPWAKMPKGPLRTYFKQEMFQFIYGGNPDRFRAQYATYGSATGRFGPDSPPLYYWEAR